MNQTGRSEGTPAQRARRFADAATPGFEQYLTAAFPAMSSVDPLVPAMKYSLLAGGKRLRPLLCMASAALFGASLESVWPAAAAVEMIHTYSLIHDDLPCMDDDDLRRGRPTNHKVYGEAMALLAGDGLLTSAFAVLSESTLDPGVIVTCVQSLATAAGPYGMVGGQVADMSTGERTLERLRFVHDHKTGKLIEAALDLGAIVGGASGVQRGDLRRFGRHSGQAFQMMDDLLDVVGTTEELGKTAGHDAAQQKLTYPALVGLEETQRLVEREFAAAIAALDAYGDAAAVLRGVAEMMVRRRK